MKCSCESFLFFGCSTDHKNIFTVNHEPPVFDVGAGPIAIKATFELHI